MTAGLWIRMREDIQKKYKMPEVTFDFMYTFGKTPKSKLLKLVPN
jgi:hypothetical protein